MIEREYKTPKGSIYYWVSGLSSGEPALVMLPGLTADHRLFDKQVEAFEGKYGLFVWDAPGQGKSRPFTLDFTLMDKAEWLHEILEAEGITRPVLIGQSMGGYVSQCFMQEYPGQAAGFISIDSAPLKRSYVTALEIALLRKTGPMYRAYPWESLKKQGSKGCSETGYGRSLMRSFIESYTKDEYCAVASHGYGMLADAMDADLPYVIDCPAMLICGEKDKAGSAKRYNKRWAEKEGLPIYWIAGAGHNSNTDKPEEINALIESFADSLQGDVKG